MGYRVHSKEGIERLVILISLFYSAENVEYRLKEFRNKMIEFSQLESIEERRWNRYMNDFLNKLSDNQST